MKFWLAVKKACAKIASYRDDALAVAGCWAVCHGVAMIYPAAAYIVAGVALLAAALLRASRDADAASGK